jgi:hypothetical protein
VTAAVAPATSAYTESPRLTTRAARPRSATYEADVVAVYLEGHFVRMLVAVSRPCA